MGDVGDVAERIARVRGRSVIPKFSEAHFLAAIKAAKVPPGGGLEITLMVPPSEKYNALPLTDAAGILIVIHAERQRRTGEAVHPE